MGACAGSPRRREFFGTATAARGAAVASPVVDPETWLADYRDRVAGLGERAGRAQHELAAAEATATSPDGAVTVTVGAAGALRGLVLHRSTTAMDRERLAAVVLATARAAQQEAAGRAVAAVVPLLGADSPAVRALRAHLPTSAPTAPAPSPTPPPTTASPG